MDRQCHTPCFRFQALLEIGSQGDHKKSAADPRKDQEKSPTQRKKPVQFRKRLKMQGERQHGTGELDPEEQGKRHAQRPEGNQTRFDLFCRKSAGKQASCRKADHRRSLEQTGGKEIAVASLCGITLAAATFLKVMALDFHFQFQTILENGMVQDNLLISFVISITVFFGVVIAKIVGTLLPIGTKRIGLDPAVMASPFITTIVDTVTLIIYFTVATLMLHL